MDQQTAAPVSNPPAEPPEAELEEFFRAGYNDEPTLSQPTPRAPAGDAPAPGPAPAAPAPASKTDATPPAEPAPPSNDDHDPYASLPEDVRKQLARIPSLEHDVASNRSRVAALNRKLEQARSSGAPASASPSPPAPAPAPIESLERVRGELPEVAQAIEDAVRARIAAAVTPAAAAPAPTPSVEPPEDASKVAAQTDDERWLNANRPGWDTKFVSTDFQLWLGRQPDDYRARMLSTDKAVDIVDALTKFESAGGGATAPAPAGDGLAERRSARARAAVTPQGAGLRAPSRTKVMTDEEAFAAGYRGENPDV